MYDRLLNQMVVVLVSPRTENFLEYTGYLREENSESIVLENVSINYAMVNFQKNVFGSGIGAYQQNLDYVVVNKSYVISCHLK